MTRHALAALIDTVKEEQQISDEQICVRARRGGHKLSKQRIAQIRAQDPLKSIVPGTIRALAAGLGLPVGRVLEAALQASGFADYASDWSVEAAIETDPELPVAARRMLLAMVREARGEPAPVRRLRPAGVPRVPVAEPEGKAARRVRRSGK
jgi:hypothetical protein